jgi:butyryl-CoA dehydrogenase
MLTEAQVQVRDMVRQFARRELAPTAAERDRTPRFPREAFARMAELGLMGMTVPAEHGGSETDYVSYVLAIMEIAAACGATGQPSRSNTGCGRSPKGGSSAALA